uniref:Uncharacterized protein MANES_11G126400 n=1 Tax=Rhizophora mucronata TaxID=61149 RepID=A0A2P2IQK3_RHIMU
MKSETIEISNQQKNEEPSTTLPSKWTRMLIASHFKKITDSFFVAKFCSRMEWSLI